MTLIGRPGHEWRRRPLPRRLRRHVQWLWPAGDWSARRTRAKLGRSRGRRIDFDQYGWTLSSGDPLDHRRPAICPRVDQGQCRQGGQGVRSQARYLRACGAAVSANTVLRRPGPGADVDVLIVGAGISGVGAAYHLHDQCPDKRYLILEGQGHLRRHLGDAQISRRAFRFGPLHLRLPLQAVDRPADRQWRRDPQIHGRGHRRERHRRSHPLRTPHQRLPLVERRQPLDRRGDPQR